MTNLRSSGNNRELVLLPATSSSTQAKAGEGTMNDLFLELYLAAQSSLERENGQGLTEYAMAFSVIALGTVAGQSAVAAKVNHTFIAVASTITTAIVQ